MGQSGIPVRRGVWQSAPEKSDGDYTMLIALVVSAGILLFLCLFLIAYYNKLVRGRNLVEEAWSGISVQLKRRHDLIPALVNTVKGYAQHEATVLRKVTEARAFALAASSGAVQDVAQAENVLTRALRSLFAVSENYPKLMASENFLQLQGQLAELEDAIQSSRRYYNGTARDQNDSVLQFPGNLIASLFRLNKVEYFELDSEGDRNAPEVNFDTGTAPAQAVSRINAESPEQESGPQNQSNRIGF